MKAYNYFQSFLFFGEHRLTRFKSPSPIPSTPESRDDTKDVSEKTDAETENIRQKTIVLNQLQPHADKLLPVLKRWVHRYNKREQEQNEKRGFAALLEDAADLNEGEHPNLQKVERTLRDAIQWSSDSRDPVEQASLDKLVRDSMVEAHLKILKGSR